MPYLEFTAQILSLIMLVLSLIFTLGIVWRVEKRLDIAYKMFFVSLVFIFLSKGADLFLQNETFLFISQILDFLFSLFLLIGIWMTRNLFMNIDGEKDKNE